MRTLAATACFTFASLLSACSPNLGDGRILCAASAPLCPDGYTCSAGRCYHNNNVPDVSGSDATLDASEAEFDASEAGFDAGVDAGLDAPPTRDVGLDAPRPTEVCTPSAMSGTTRTDEDADGAIDEGCAPQTDIVHPITDAQIAGGGYDFTFPRLSDDGLTLVYCSVEGSTRTLWRATRSSVGERFSGAVRLDLLLPDACAAQPFGMGYYVEGATSDGGIGIFFFATRTSPPMELINLRATVGASGHPFVNADGTQIFFEGNRRQDGTRTLSNGLYVARRMGEAFGTPQRVTFDGPLIMSERDMFPTLSPDGLTLFFVRVTATATTPMMARRTAVTVNSFSEPTPFPLGLPSLGSFAPSMNTWEVVASSTHSTATAGNVAAGQPHEGLFRARFCADGCPARDARSQLSCETDPQRSADGLHCYTVGDSAMSNESADGFCAVSMPTLPQIRVSRATIHNDIERALVWAIRPTASDVWIGATRAGPLWSWIDGEPYTDYVSAPVFWGTGEPTSVGGCAQLTSTATRLGVPGFGAEVDCTSGRAAPACETDLWPTW